VTNSISPAGIYVCQLYRKAVSRVARRVIGQFLDTVVVGESRWPVAEKFLKGLNLGLDRFVGRAFHVGYPINAQHISAGEVIASLPGRELSDVFEHHDR